MIKQILYLLLAFITLNCSSQTTENKKLTQVEKFLGYLKDNKPDGIYEMSYHVNYRNSITDKSSRESNVALISELIKENGLPPKEKWIYTFNPNSAIEQHKFVIPISFDALSKKTCIELIIVFPPEQISDKIYDYSLKRNLECLLFEPPVLPPKDTTGKNDDD